MKIGVIDTGGYNMAKRILQVFASLDVGGAETRMMEVYRNIDKSKVDFDFLTMQLKDQFYDFLQKTIKKRP